MEILKDSTVLELRLSIAIVSERALDLLVSLHEYFQILSSMVTCVNIWICGFLEMVPLNHNKHGFERGRERRAEET